MRKESSGNFLTQALLAIALVAAFMPFLARKMSNMQHESTLAAAASQLKSVAAAEKRFLKSDGTRLNYNPTVVAGDDVADMLEPYGLALGFIPKTPFGDDISLLTLRKNDEIIAFVIASKGDMSRRDAAELARRVGFWGATAENGEIIGATGGWKIIAKDYGIRTDDTAVYIRVSAADDYSELVRKNDIAPDKNSFMSDLIMDGNSLRAVGSLVAESGFFDSAQTNALTLYGIEDGRRIKNKIASIYAKKAGFFAENNAAALTVQKGILNADNVSVRTVSRYGDAGNLTADTISVHDFSMAAGRTGFTGPEKWEIKGDAVLENVSLTVERIDINSSINAARGQDVFISDDGLSYNVKTGIESDYVSAANITMRDQTSAAISSGSSGPVILDIRPTGTSILPDAFITSINNDSILIPSAHDDNTGKTITCKSVIDSLNIDTNYNKNSLAQNLACKFVLWQRLEKRIDMKKCLMEGRSGC